MTFREITIDEAAAAGAAGFERDLFALTFERVHAGSFAVVTDTVERVTGGRPGRCMLPPDRRRQRAPGDDRPLRARRRRDRSFVVSLGAIGVVFGRCRQSDGGGDPGDGVGEPVSLVGGQCAGDVGHAIGDVGVERADDLLSESRSC